MKNYYIFTYGCQMNEADSLWLEKIFGKCGYSKAEDVADADVILINTCSVRQAAEDKVYGLAPKIRRLKEAAGETPEVKSVETSGVKEAAGEYSPLTVILTGCMVGSATGDRRRIKLDILKKRMPWVDYFVPPGDIFVKLPEILSNQSSVEALHAAPLGPAGVVVEGGKAYVPIMRGCDNFCSYCVVPFGRGAERYREFENIVRDVERLVEDGVVSVTLLGQNVNSYPNFADLLKRLHSIDGLEELWFLTSNPWDFPEELIEVLAYPKMRKYLHLPLQSGDNEILKRMNRPYTIEEYKDLVERIRAEVTEIKIGTDLIVGFPGETKEQFQHTLDAVREVKFDGAYIAMYSPRPGTAAAKQFEDDVPRKEKKRRHAELTKVVEKNTL